ncbi:MAG: flagellar basal body P-ring protein FlgI [Hyphomonadaceae bacterium]|nr:flagellar basal body P-ring protein FlgI [Hyphomonadaceae bacterium]
MRIWQLAVFLFAAAMASSAQAARIKDIARVEGMRDNPLVGYGIVIGLAGTGDSARSQAGLQSVENTLARFGINVDRSKFGSRNVAAVLATADLPAFANTGDRVDVTVSSIGDARSLAGGTLFMTPLQGPDGKTYALAQGALSVGGFRYDAFGNIVQKNHPTAGAVPGGATIELAPATSVVSRGGSVYLLLARPDFTTARRVAQAIENELGAPGGKVTAEGPDRVVVRLSESERPQYVAMIERLERLEVDTDQPSTVVVNERTGTVVSGGDIRLEQVTIAQGDLRVSVATSYQVSQPTLVSRPGDGIRTVVVPEADISVSESSGLPISLSDGATVTDLVVALHKVKASPRDIIAVLRGIERAGALNARLVIQ